MLSALEEVEVLLLGLQEVDALWQEWSKAQDAGLTDLHYSTDRCTVRYQFMAKLEAALQKKTPGVKILRKDVWQAFQEAETQAKFSAAQGKSAIRRQQDVDQIMSFGDNLKKWHLMDDWRDLEVFEDGKTPLYHAAFAVTFPGLVNHELEEATYVLGQLKRIYRQDPRGKAQLTKKKLLDAKAPKMKAFIKTLDLQYLWAKSLIESCEGHHIEAPQKMLVDFQLVKQALDINLGVNLMEDKSGKKAALHPCTADLLSLCLAVLVGLEHFNTFMGAEAMNKPFQATCRTESLHRLQDEGVTTAWKDASARYVSEMKKANDEKDKKDAGAAEEEEQEVTALPTRVEAIQRAAEVEIDTYCPYYIKTGDPAVDRHAILNFPTARKDNNTDTAAWNLDTQGNRRITFYDEAGRRNPKWAYVSGRNQYRCKIGFAKEDFEEAIDVWSNMAAPADGEKKQKIDVLSVWNVDQAPASKAIRAKAGSITGVTVKKTTLKGLQKDVERRLWSGTPAGADHFLEGLPGVSEECFDIFAGPLPGRKKHLHAFGPFVDNLYPEEIIPLRNTTKSEPQVPMSVKKIIFPPDYDEVAGGNSLREDEVGTCIT
jgi:hypothetical protein